MSEQLTGQETAFKRAEQLVETYPELSWMVGNGVQATPERSLTGTTATVGQQLYPKAGPSDLIEFDRAYVGITSLDAVLADDYESLTAAQAPAVRMSRRSFDDLRGFTQSVLTTPAAEQALETFIAVNDLGKIDHFAAAVHELPGAPVSVDHDVIMHYGLQNKPELSPSFQKLEERYRTDIIDGMASSFNLIQMMQGEGVAASLQGLADVSPEARDFYLLHSVYDLAGAAGHVVQNGSVILNEPTVRNVQFARQALDGLGESKNANQAYHQYLDNKADQYDIDLTDPSGTAVTRLASMLRCTSADQAQRVQTVYDNLPVQTQAILQTEMDKSGTDDGIASLLYYSPALLANLQKHAGNDDDQWQANMTAGLTTLARLYQAGRSRSAVLGSRENGIQTILISELAAAGNDPESLTASNIVFEGEGLDVTAHLQSVNPFNIDLFPRLADLADIAGERFAVVGMGGGSDGIQAAIMSKLLVEAGKECPAVVSIRASKPQSQSGDGQISARRTINDHGGEVVEGAYRITTETRGSGRFLEHLPAGEVPMYLVTDEQQQPVTDRLQAIFNSVGGVDAVIGLDTGGDVLYPTIGHEFSQTTPDQDLRSLEAISNLGAVANKYCMVLAPGIDSPDDAEDRLMARESRYFEPDTDQVAEILSTYKRWQMDGSDSRYFGKTPLAWQTALQSDNIDGIMTVNLPVEVVTDSRNPWNPYVMGQKAMRGAFIYEIED